MQRQPTYCPQRSLLIGWTGGIGSGKSILAQLLTERGYPVYDTDKEAKRIMACNPVVRAGIERLFGRNVYDGDTYLAHKVAEQVFARRDLLDRLNGIVHPAVLDTLQQWYRTQCERQADCLCFVESALLYTGGLDRVCDCVVNVTAPDDVRQERIMLRDRLTPEQAQARIQSQEGETRKAQQADIVLVNDGITPHEQLIDRMFAELEKRHL